MKRRARILIIDDDPVFADTLEFVLQQHRHILIVANDGEEGVALAIECMPDIILCDVRMKQMHGYATVQALKKHPETSGIPVIMMTGYATSPYGERRCLMSGADYYIAKPFTSSKLLETVNQALNSGVRLEFSKDLILDD